MIGLLDQRQHLNGALAGGVGASPGGHQGCAGGRERTLSRWREARVSDRRLCSALCQVRGTEASAPMEPEVTCGQIPRGIVGCISIF